MIFGKECDTSQYEGDHLSNLLHYLVVVTQKVIMNFLLIVPLKMSVRHCLC
jgi:hypothetical protein